MTTLTVHQCFRCDLRFPTVAELEDHLVVDHHVDLRHPSDPAPVPEATHGTLVVAVSPANPIESAVTAGVAIAHQAGMALEVVEVDEPGFADTMDRHLTACADAARAHGLRAVTTERLALTDGGVAETLLAHLRDTRPTFASMQTKRRSAMGDVVLGSVSRPVVAGSPVPVLLTHPNIQPASHYQRIVAGVDGSDLAERAVGPAVDLARRLGASVWVVQVVDPEMVPTEVPESGYVQRLAQGWAKQGVEVGYEVLHGPVRRSLVRFGEDEPGTILVVGSHGRTGSRLGSLGSVSRDVVRHADCPVLVVGPAYGG
jgi:nucleotide-binding universal stress UspA family protein